MMPEAEILPTGGDAFWTATRVVYLLLAAGFAAVVLKGQLRRYGMILLGAILLVGWGASNHGLSRIYGLVVPGDRARNLSWCMAAAAGHSPLGTGIVGQTSLEPFWATLVAALSFWSPERALALYPFLSLAGLLAVATSLYLHFRRFDEAGEREPQGARNDALGLLVAAFATLFATSALDFVGPFRGFWAKMFLLKPNHTVGFILLPFVVGSFLRASGRRVVGAGLLLGILSLAFLVHWAFVCVSLCVYLVLTGLLRRRDLFPETRRTLAIALISSVFVLPGVYVLARYFPHALTLAAGTYPEAPMRSDWGDTIPTGVSLLWLATFDQGIIFLLALCGAGFWLRERTRAALVWISLLTGAYLLWGLNYLLYVTSRAREADEFYFFLVFVQAIAAGYGAFRLLEVAGERLFHSAETRTRALAAGILLAAPLGFPFWWNPRTMDSHYRVALDPIPPPVVATTDWIRRETRNADVFLAAGDMFQWIPALSGRRSLPFSDALREPLLRLIENEDVSALSADYVVWNPDLADAAGVSYESIDRSPCCRLSFDAHVIAIYEVARQREE